MRMRDCSGFLQIESHILILYLLVTNLFMHSLPGMILLHLATPCLHQRCFCIRYVYTWILHTYIWKLWYIGSSIFHTAPQSVNGDILNKISEMQVLLSWKLNFYCGFILVSLCQTIHPITCIQMYLFASFVSIWMFIIVGNKF